MRVCCVLGGEEVDELIRLRDDVIFQLKQRIADLEHTVNEPSQTPIKKEGMSIAPTIACSVCVCIIMCVCL